MATSENQNEKTSKPWLWAKGQSGNPKGRPRKERSVTQCIHEILEQTEFDGKTIEGGRKVAWAIATGLVRGALGGDIQFIREVLDRSEGKPVAALPTNEDDMKLIHERMLEYESAADSGDVVGDAFLVPDQAKPA